MTLILFVLQSNLQNSMRSRRIKICSSNTCGSDWISKFYSLHHLIYGFNRLLLYANNIHIRFTIFSRMQLLAIIQQIKQFPAINLKKWHVHCQILISLLYSVVKNVLYSQQIQPWYRLSRFLILLISWITHHSVRFSTTSLSISKASDFSPVKSGIDKGLDAG